MEQIIIRDQNSIQRIDSNYYMNLKKPKDKILLELYKSCFAWLFWCCLIGLSINFDGIFNSENMINNSRTYIPTIRFYTENGHLINSHILIDGYSAYKISLDGYLNFCIVIGLFSIVRIIYVYYKLRKNYATNDVER